MKKACRDCQYFKQLSMVSTKYVWGDCMKPQNWIPDTNDKNRSVAFTWADKTCDDFKPRQKPERE